MDLIETDDYILFKVTYRNLDELNIEVRTNNNHKSKNISEWFELGWSETVLSESRSFS